MEPNQNNNQPQNSMPGSVTTQPVNPATPQAAPSPNPVQPTVPPIGTPPPGPKKTNKAGIIAAIIVFLVLLAGSAALLLTQNNQMEDAPISPTNVQSQPTEQPTAIPTQDVEDEIDAVDTGASGSSELDDVQNDIDNISSESGN